MPSNSEYIILNGLLWDTEYVVYVVAENQKGKSQPASISFRTSTEPEAIPGTPFPQATPTKLQLKQEKENHLKAKLKAPKPRPRLLLLPPQLWKVNDN